MKSEKVFLSLATIAIVALLVIAYAVGPVGVSASPSAAVLTPVSNGAYSNGFRNYDFAFPTSITADTTKCVDAAQYQAADIQYQIVETTPNAVTLTVKRYSIAPSNTPVYEDGVQLAATVTATQHGDAQVALYDRYTCIHADVDTSVPVTIRAVSKFH